MDRQLKLLAQVEIRLIARRRELLRSEIQPARLTLRIQMTQLD